MEEKQTLEQLEKKLDDFKPSDDPQADATRLAGYMKDMLGFIKRQANVEEQRRKTENQAHLHAQMSRQNIPLQFR